jgi:glucan phosphorylase
MVKNQRSKAYFSVEIVLDTRMPTYSGGLEVLAGSYITVSVRKCSLESAA